MYRLPFLLCLLPLLVFLLPLITGASPLAPKYELAISFETQKGMLSGTAHISLPPQEDLTLSLQGITVTGILINRDGREALTMTLPDKQELYFPASSTSQELFISYSITVGPSYSNRIKEDGITLTSNWYPQPDKDMIYSLKAEVPEEFTAISESDQLHFDNRKGIHFFGFSQPLPGIHFAAAPYQLNSLQLREGLTIYTLFFDDALAEDYLQAAAGYIQRYESEIGPFPYNHYAVVENHLPTGLGMPTFTLLGQAVIRLPFIKDTSLGHEVLHSWFGNSVGVDGRDGNWCESLTSYLADWAYRDEKREGASSRKESILGYVSYVNSISAIPLSEFNSASHFQPMARAIRAVGYTRGAFLFHELKNRVGSELFGEGIRRLYTEFAGKKASWDDIRKIFEQTSSKELTPFFAERLSRKDIPKLTLNNIDTRSHNNQSRLSFDLIQETNTPYTLQVVIQVKTVEKEIRFTRIISESTTNIVLDLPNPPLSMTLDPEYDILRELQPSETTPIWSGFMGAQRKLVIVSSEEDEKILAPFVEHFKDDSWVITAAENIKNTDLSGASLLFLGINNEASRSLFALPDHAPQGFTLDVRTNPLNEAHVAVLVSSSSRGETAAVSRRLSHYGKYSSLHFKNGKVIKKEIRPSTFGNTFVFEQLPMGAPTASLNSFEAIVEKLSTSRVVYVGESHTSYADHLLQFRLIQALYARNPNLAIGMEMFPKSSQDALDDYINGKKGMDENTFLKKSRYFEVWRYDWRFFRDIFNFAKHNTIPVIGLNLDRKIVSQVFKKGSTDELSEEDQMNLPVDRDLSMTGYRERLTGVHGFHMQGGHGNGMMSGFIQAQGLWDETMAENIASYLKNNPKTQMVVLAGSQHTRKDSGIPPRVQRRLDIPQSSVLNVYNDGAPSNVEALADYYFMAETQTLPPAAKIGVVLNIIEEDAEEHMQITKVSPHGNAGKAGVQEKDILLYINGHSIHEMEDIQIAMIDAREGDTVSLVIKRKNEYFPDEEIQLDVELYTPKMGRPHP